MKNQQKQNQSHCHNIGRRRRKCEMEKITENKCFYTAYKLNLNRIWLLDNNRPAFEIEHKFICLKSENDTMTQIIDFNENYVTLRQTRTG